MEYLIKQSQKVKRELVLLPHPSSVSFYKKFGFENPGYDKDRPKLMIYSP
jgi:predicted acetyltransferase